MKNAWWKILTIAILLYVAVASLLMEAPRLNILNETVRVLHYHVPMWFGMIILFLISMIASIGYLRTGKDNYDAIAIEFANVAIVFGIFGLLTGMVWAQFTWGDWWSGDPKQNASAVGMMIYLAYFVLRGSFQNEDQRNRISAVYNIFAFMALIPLLFILPRLTDSLHPGNGGNPGFNAYDLDNRLRMVFYPAVIGWTLLGVWIATIRMRIKRIERIAYDA